MPKRKVLFLFAHLHKGGMQKAVSNISTALPDQFEQYVGFFGTENPGFSYNAVMHNFNLPPVNSTGIFRKTKNAINRILAIRRFVKNEKIDVVVSFGELANIYSLISKHAAKKIITSRVSLLESMTGSERYRRMYLFLIRRLYPAADSAVAVSEALAKDMREATNNEVQVRAIPNLYHIEEIKRLANEPLSDNYSFLHQGRFILNVGSLCHQKAQDDLLKVFALVHENDKDIFLVIIGQGEWREKLSSQTEALGLSDKTVFIDFDLNPYRYMAKAAVFALTSRFEGFPNVLVEAMICNTPVVAFDCPTGPAEILGENSQFGFLIKNRSIVAAADRISQLLYDRTLHQNMIGIGHARAEYYSKSNVISSWIGVLH